MVTVPYVSTAPVPPPAYHRIQAQVGPALHIDALTALTLVTRLHLPALCRLAVRLAQRRCPPPLPADPGGHPPVYHEETLLLIALLRTLWCLSYQDMHDWLADWPALARACGLPHDRQGGVRVPSPAQQCKRAQRVGAPPYEMLFVVLVHLARHTRLGGGRDVIVDSAPILAWRRTDPHTTIPVRCCAAIASTRCCVVVPACRCSSCSPQPTPTTPPSPVRSWSWRGAGMGCGHASCAWTPAIGASA